MFETATTAELKIRFHERLFALNADSRDVVDAEFLLLLILGETIPNGNLSQYPLVTKRLSLEERKNWSSPGGQNQDAKQKLVVASFERIIRSNRVTMTSKQEDPLPGYRPPEFVSRRLKLEQLPLDEHKGVGGHSIKRSKLEEVVPGFQIPASKGLHSINQQVSSTIGPLPPNPFPQELPFRGVSGSGGAIPQRPLNDEHKKILSKQRKQNSKPRSSSNSNTKGKGKASAALDDSMDEDEEDDSQPLPKSKGKGKAKATEDDSIDAQSGSPFDDLGPNERLYAYFKRKLPHGQGLSLNHASEEKEEKRTGLNTVQEALKQAVLHTQCFELSTSHLLSDYSKVISQAASCNLFAMTCYRRNLSTLFSWHFEVFNFQDLNHFKNHASLLSLAIGNDLTTSVASIPRPGAALANADTPARDQATAWAALQRTSAASILPIDPPARTEYQWADVVASFVGETTRMLGGNLYRRLGRVVESTLFNHREYGSRLRVLVMLLSPDNGHFKKKNGRLEAKSDDQRLSEGLQVILSLFLFLQRGATFKTSKDEFEKKKAAREEMEELVKSRRSKSTASASAFASTSTGPGTAAAAVAEGADALGDNPEDLGNLDLGADLDDLDLEEEQRIIDATGGKDEEAVRFAAEKRKAGNKLFRTFLAIPGADRCAITEPAISRLVTSFMKDGKERMATDRNHVLTREEKDAAVLVGQTVVELFDKFRYATSLRGTTETLTPLDVSRLGSNSMDLCLIIVILETHPGSNTNLFHFGKQLKYHDKLVPRTKAPANGVSFRFTDGFGCQLFTDPQHYVKKLGNLMDQVVHSFGVLPSPPAAPVPPPDPLNATEAEGSRRTRKPPSARGGRAKLAEDQAKRNGKSEEEIRADHEQKVQEYQQLRQEHEEQLVSINLRRGEVLKQHIVECQSLLDLSSVGVNLLQDPEIWLVSPLDSITTALSLLSHISAMIDNQQSHQEIERRLSSIRSLKVVINPRLLQQSKGLEHRMLKAYVSINYPEGTLVKHVLRTKAFERATQIEATPTMSYAVFSDVRKTSWWVSALVLLDGCRSLSSTLCSKRRRRSNSFFDALLKTVLLIPLFFRLSHSSFLS